MSQVQGEAPPAGRPRAGGGGPAGWPVLHLFYRVDRARWQGFSATQREAAVAAFGDLLTRVRAEAGMQLVASAVLGKADLALMAVHPDLRRVQRLTQQVAATALGACLQPAHSFLSISEQSEYMSTAGDQARKLIDEQRHDPASAEFQQQITGFTRRMAAYAEARLHPELPGEDYPVLCFYPMSKARGEVRNWYALPFNERKRLMGAHAEAGRRFADRVQQLITSSTGIDDWEWGVTLFTRDLKSIRDIVYEMRYDEGSALYGRFGPFFVSVRFRPEELGQVLQLQDSQEP